MAPNPWGTLIYNKIQALGVTAGTPISQATVEACWQKMAEATKEHFETNLTLDLQANDIPVPANNGAGLISAAPGNPVTGATANNAATITGRMK
jgi:hypothetical protein